MARPQKNNADYFPHDNDLRNDRRCKALRSKYGIEGYGVFTMLLEVLTQADHFQVEYTALETELLAGDFDMGSDKLKNIIDYLLSVGLLEQTNTHINSPLLNDLKKILAEYREKERSRKRDGKQGSIEVFRLENLSTNANRGIIRPENGILSNSIPVENLQRKLNEKKENISKEKRGAEISPNFLKNENINIPGSVLQSCKELFLKDAKFYYWEKKDDENLLLLTQKIIQTIKNIRSDQDLVNKFSKFITKLPEYWRSKKFTITNLNQNFNEIVNEIRVKGKVKPRARYHS